MARTPFTVAAVTAVVVGLALPAVAAGQAIPRHGTGSAGSAGTSSSGSGGGVSAGSSGSGSGVSQPPSNPGPSRVGSGSDDSGTTFAPGKGGGRGPSPNQPPPPGGVARSAPAITAPVNSTGERRVSNGVGDDTQGFSTSLNRPRGDNPVTGFAAPRQYNLGGGGSGDGDFVSFPFWGPWGSWYPWYSGGFGWGFGYYGYNPWYYGATCWGWGRWGAWYDPFGYCWNPYWGAPTTYVEIAGGGHKPAAPSTGKIRILTSPKTANVYIDDALVGTVDEFDGLGDHLELDKGRHVVSIKADGYETAVKEVVVEGGKTQTVRLSMKKIK